MTSGVVYVIRGSDEPAVAVLGHDEKRLPGKECVAFRGGAIVKFLNEFPIIDVFEIIDTKAIHVVLRYPEFSHLAKEFPRGKVVIVRGAVEVKEILPPILATG